MKDNQNQITYNVYKAIRFYTECDLDISNYFNDSENKLYIEKYKNQILDEILMQEKFLDKILPF